MKQGIWEESLLPQYDVGTRIQVGQRVFHYSRAVNALEDKRGVGDGGTTREMIPPVVNGYKGDLSVTIGSAGGANSCSTVLVHEYIGGWFAAYAVGLSVMTLLRIKDNDAPLVDDVKIYLQDPLIRDMLVGVGAPTCDIYHNIYNNITFQSGAVALRVYMSVVCVPLIAVQAGYYFWGQTWGPCLTLAQAVGIGGIPLERAVYFADDGSIGAMDDCAGFATHLPQYAGYVLGQTYDARAGVDAAADSIFYMLQLAP